MCFRIFAFIRNAIKACIYIAIDVIVFFACSLSDFIDSIEWPVIKAFYGIFKLILKKQFEKKITYSTDYDDEAIRKGNAYVDELLRDMFEDNENFDPYRIGKRIRGVIHDMFGNASGEAILHDGTIKGLRTLHRSGDCILEDDGEKLIVKAHLRAGVLSFFYAGGVKVMNFVYPISVNGELAYIEVYLTFTVDAKTGENGKLTKFVIDDMSGMAVCISGLGLTHWALNPIINGVTEIFKRFVRNFMENRVRTYIAERILGHQFPVEGGHKKEAPSSSATPEDTTQTQELDTPTPQSETQIREEISHLLEMKTPTPLPEEKTPTTGTPTPVSEEPTPAPENSLSSPDQQI